VNTVWSECKERLAVQECHHELEFEEALVTRERQDRTVKQAPRDDLVVMDSRAKVQLVLKEMPVKQGRQAVLVQQVHKAQSDQLDPGAIEACLETRVKTANQANRVMLVIVARPATTQTTVHARRRQVVRNKRHQQTINPHRRTTPQRRDRVMAARLAS